MIGNVYAEKPHAVIYGAGAALDQRENLKKNTDENKRHRDDLPPLRKLREALELHFLLFFFRRLFRRSLLGRGLFRGRLFFGLRHISLSPNMQHQRRKHARSQTERAERDAIITEIPEQFFLHQPLEKHDRSDADDGGGQHADRDMPAGQR